ncbi:MULTISPECIES: sulfite exporter TauE/SafE family protein [unclassified Sporosarcina]|uniref:sulfite exporter TauE/SafE family protein n=1 Tax=unclassified Sporosarcina TaxID=2647733 RepID=UPI000C163DA1|nr:MULTISPECIES: sulfite exporter TauE/SafE family protein [unclassified Sporosarcina]PID00436.1 permease [Sporosarcina sp. P29]PID05725.1 permease [Sporosarcina sp. P30]PID08919.1 permease [Sporosarcina sp. P31]PID12005.1 permease [Sporosarcina sp. P32b]
MSFHLIVLVIIAVFIGALSRATFGFGEAVVSMPLLALLSVDLHTSIALIGLVGLTVALFTVVSEWRHADRPALLRLVIGALAGIPVGIVLVVKLPDTLITIALGIFLILYGSYSFGKSLLQHTFATERLKAKFWSWPVGFVSGVLGSAYNTHGVPVVVYGTLRRWEPKRFRGTLQAHFLITGTFIVAGQALGGLWSKDVFILYGYSFPTVILATWLGISIQRRMPNEKFIRYVFLLLAFLGAILLLTSI